MSRSLRRWPARIPPARRKLRDIARDQIQGCARLGAKARAFAGCGIDNRLPGGLVIRQGPRSCRETAPDDFVRMKRQPSVARNQPGLKVPGKGVAEQIGNYAEVNRYFMRREHIE